MPPPLPRYDPHEPTRAQQAIERATRNTQVGEPHTTPAGGDHKALRGIPVTAPGVSSTSPGTNPLAALLDKHRTALA